MSLEMYREQIIDLYKNPLNFGSLKNPTHKYKEFNSLCGDEIEIFLVIENNKVKDVKFEGKGCAISIASASLITEEIKGKNIESIKKMNFTDIKKLMGIDVIYTRVKCATLALDAIKRALNKDN
ncbi:MAG: iron-sulfur cluster assembly scaffold protein [Nanoarchaeota archaeon]